jgi:hypothetical protein
MKCHNCEKNAMYAVGPEGQRVPLCLDCYIQWENLQLRQVEMLERQINFAAAEMEAVVGISGLLPRYPERRLLQMGAVTLNNIHVTNSEIGVLNTGTIQSVDSSLTVLKSGGNDSLADAIRELTESIIRASEIASSRKDEALELIGSLSQEAVAPKEKRKLAVAKALFGELSGILGGIASVGQAWAKAEPILRQIFGF